MADTPTPYPPFAQWTEEEDSGALRGLDPLPSPCCWKAKLAHWLWPCLPDKFLNPQHLYEPACAYWIWWRRIQILRMGLAVMPSVSRPTRSGCKVAIYAATPGREGSADLEIMTLPPLLRFTLTISAHDPIFLCPSPCVKSLAVLLWLW